MSADNGVYILETAGPEFRVVHAQGIENIEWDPRINTYTKDPSVILDNARRIFRKSPVFTNQKDALEYAYKIYESLDVCEYGMCSIDDLKKEKF